MTGPYPHARIAASLALCGQKGRVMVASNAALADPSGGFVALPPALFDLELSPGAFRTLAELCRMADRDGWCWPSLAQLAARIGRGRATISGYVDELRAAGLAETETQRTATGHNYRLRYRVVFWSAWRQALAGRRAGAGAASAPAAERCVQSAERKESNQIHRNQESAPAADLVSRWLGCAGRATYPAFDFAPSPDLVQETERACSLPPLDPARYRDALARFLSSQGLHACADSLSRDLSGRIDLSPEELVTQIAAAWQPHWRKPPTAAQILRLAGLGDGAASRQQLLRSFLNRWRRIDPSLVARPISADISPWPTATSSLSYAT